MKKTRLVALIGFLAFLALRLAELLFMTDGQGYFLESTRFLRLLPVVFVILLIVILSKVYTEGPFIRVGDGVFAAVFCVSAIAAVCEGVLGVIKVGYDNPFAAFVQKAASALEAQRLLELRLALLSCVLSIAAAVWLVLCALEALGRRVPDRADKVFRVLTLVWLWLRILCAYVFAPINSADALTFPNMLCAMLVGLAFTRLGGLKYSDLPPKKAFAFAIACVCFTFATCIPTLALVREARGARFFVEIICNLLLALSALCAECRAEIIAERKTTDEQKSN